jgi:hypothetical protein
MRNFLLRQHPGSRTDILILTKGLKPMDRVHKKRRIGKTPTLLLAARDLEAELLLGGYEQQLPLCAFTSKANAEVFQVLCRINLRDERGGVAGPTGTRSSWRTVPGHLKA